MVTLESTTSTRTTLSLLTVTRWGILEQVLAILFTAAVKVRAFEDYISFPGNILIMNVPDYDCISCAIRYNREYSFS